MNASTSEALSQAARVCRRDIGGRWRFPAPCPAVGSRAAPSRTSQGRNPDPLKPQTGTPSLVSMRTHAARQVAIMEPNGTPLCDWFEIC
jgi:hypothetical protein